MNKQNELIRNSFYHMVDVGFKKKTHRKAIAQGKIEVKAKAFKLIKEHQLPKGDPLALAEIAGINGAKKTHDLIPLCHPLPLNHIAIYTECNEKDSTITVYCVVSSFARTGVEMEALAGVNAALLTIYDLTKPIEPALTLSDIRLLIKEGGKQGLWIHPDGIPKTVQQLIDKKESVTLEKKRVAVVTLSDRAVSHEYEDISGKLLKDNLISWGGDICDYFVLPDEKEFIVLRIKKLIAEQKPDLIITTGSTGLASRDVMPEAMLMICDRLIPGFGELLRHDGGNYYTQFAWLSRCVAGIKDESLIISLPGSPKAVQEGIEILQDILPHALHIINGGDHE